MNASRFKVLRKEFDAIAKELKVSSDADRKLLLEQLRDLVAEIDALVREVDAEVRSTANTFHR